MTPYLSFLGCVNIFCLVFCWVGTGRTIAVLDKRKHWSALSHSSLAQVAMKDIQSRATEALDAGVFGSEWKKPDLWAGLEQWPAMRTANMQTLWQLLDQINTFHSNKAITLHICQHCLCCVPLCFTWRLNLCLQVWSLKLEQEVEKNKALTEALQTLATEHHELKQSLSKSRRLSTLSTLTGDEFYDALSGQQPRGWTVSDVMQKSFEVTHSPYINRVHVIFI